MNIILIGFASSGKTTSATVLSEITSIPHIDLDREIESLYGKKNHRKLTIREIFKEIGKEAFILLENETLQNLQGTKSRIISTGGHAPLDPQNRILLRNLGKIVYLKVGPQKLFERMSEKGLPASIRDGKEGLIREWHYRDPIYTKLSDFIIDNELLTPEETAREILCLYTLCRAE
ncbi:Shikimate kinase I [Chitinispirillum alkaliphilum]|nr:Shikimate kinase I [Chitinispirillum alkaliphilum]